MRIGIDLRSPEAPSGQQRYLWGLGGWLGQQGHQVDFLCTKKDSADTAAPEGCRIHPLHHVGPRELARHIRSLGLQVLMINPERSRTYLGVRPNVLRPGYGTDQYRQKLRSFRNPAGRIGRTLLRVSPPLLRHRRIERGFYHGGPLQPEVIAVSEYMGREILDSYRLDPERVHLVYNGIDLSEFSPHRRTELREPSRREWGIPDEAFCVLSMAHNFRLKGVWEVMRQVKRLRADGLNLHLLVAGRGTGPGQRRKAMRFSARLGLGESVHMPGQVQPAMRAFAAADAFLFPSWHDAFGFVILEAMACGLPVITTRYAGASELLEDGRSGFIVDPALSDQVGARLRDLLDPGLRARMGAQARSEAEGHSEVSNFRRVEAIFRLAAERWPGPIS